MQLIIKIPKNTQNKINDTVKTTRYPIENNKHFIKLIEHFADYKGTNIYESKEMTEATLFYGFKTIIQL
jgi:type IV secretory pathway ATPase VirB11/archaellum biosynthesis ATPase